jgi:hypothetical protein
LRLEDGHDLIALVYGVFVGQIDQLDDLVAEAHHPHPCRVANPMILQVKRLLDRGHRQRPDEAAGSHDENLNWL